MKGLNDNKFPLLILKRVSSIPLNYCIYWKQDSYTCPKRESYIDFWYWVFFWLKIIVCYFFRFFLYVFSLPFVSEYLTKISLGILRVCVTKNSPKSDQCVFFNFIQHDTFSYANTYLPRSLFWQPSHFQILRNLAASLDSSCQEQPKASSSVFFMTCSWRKLKGETPLDKMGVKA